jgi:hypothetical protein
MSIEDLKCDVCNAELSLEDCYYVYAGRLQQGPMSDKKSAMEYNMCTTCFTQIKADMLVSIQRKKNSLEKK